MRLTSRARPRVAVVTLALAPILAIAVASASTAGASGRASARASAPAPPTASVDAHGAQRIDHFGASGAWWPNDLVQFPAAVQRQVANLLFGPKGIALSGYRYNIGGGGAGVTDATRAPQTFLVAPGTYDWTRDQGGVAFLELAARHHVPVIVGFVNSAPVAFTTNGANCGGQVRPDAVAGYARYLADVVARFRRDAHIDLAYVSPMNEPDNSFSNCGQEGMAFPSRNAARSSAPSPAR